MLRTPVSPVSGSETKPTKPLSRKAVGSTPLPQNPSANSLPNTCGTQSGNSLAEMAVAERTVLTCPELALIRALLRDIRYCRSCETPTTPSDNRCGQDRKAGRACCRQITLMSSRGNCGLLFHFCMLKNLGDSHFNRLCPGADSIARKDESFSFGSRPGTAWSNPR